MSAQPLAVLNAGLVTSVGLSAPASCAAIRAKLTNPTETRFIGSDGEWIMSHAVPLEQPWRGREKLARMAAMAIEECLSASSREVWSQLPLLLCLSERSRPGRFDGLDERLLPEICELLEIPSFAAGSAIVPHGRVSIGYALMEARRLLQETEAPAVVIAATDSLLTWPTLKVLQDQERLLSTSNSNGFIPGEAASAVLISRATGSDYLSIEGLGVATETASIDSEEPLRASGLSQAIIAALKEAGREMHDMDFRITDLSGEQYYFKEAALALSRTLRVRKEEFDIWHPAECVGEVGCAIGPMLLAVASAAGRKDYLLGNAILLHAANDSGERAAIVTRYVTNP